MSETDETDQNLSFNFADFLAFSDDELEENENPDQFLNDSIEMENDQEELQESFDQSVICSFCRLELTFHRSLLITYGAR